jgi:hypothetical protein
MTKTQQRRKEENSKNMRQNSFGKYRFLEDTHIVELYKEEKKEEKMEEMEVEEVGKAEA